jgi:hypothetical protein
VWINKPFLKRVCLLAIFLLPSPILLANSLLESDRVLLTKIQKDTLQYFVRLSDKKTGLTRDSSQPSSPASIAATGFSLAAFAIADSHGWLPKGYAAGYIRKTLHALLRHTEHREGFFFHFIDRQSGKRVWGSEASSIDTALLVAGALLAGQYYPGTDIERMAQQIYARVNWAWMQNESSLICMGWKPESGFLPYYWDAYNELIILQALAIGASHHPVPPEAWQEWARWEDEYAGKSIIYSSSGSLFTYQYAQAFIDFRGLDDGGVNYFENSKKATEINLAYSLAFRNQHRSYSESSWGLSASLGPGGYKAYGSKPGEGLQDGTVAPYAAIGSIVFTPNESISAIRYFYENHKDQLYGHFGFKAAFNLDKNWWADQYLGIDQGISFLMLENFLNDGAIWKKFMALESIQNWIALTGLGGETAAA